MSLTFVGTSIAVASRLYLLYLNGMKQQEPDALMSDSSIDTLLGVGSVTRGWLEDAGIHTMSELQAMGSVEAYRRLKFMLPRRVSLNALYGLESALRGCHWLDLPQDVKATLQQQAKAIDEALRRGGASRCTVG
jgi:DNA transformation protein